MRLADFEGSDTGHLSGVPAHVVRSAITNVMTGAVARLTGDAARAHACDATLAFAAGYIAERVQRPAVRAALSSSRPAWPLTTSIVIPCFDQTRFLCRALESALTQTWPSTEVVVVDDGSSEDVAGVVAAYHGVRYIRHASRAGVAAARNAGLVDCDGDFVVFLDADDELLPDAVETGISRLLADPRAAFTAGRATPIDEHGVQIDAPPPAVRAGVDDRFAKLTTTNFIWTPGAALFRRGVLLRAGGFDPRWSSAADYELYLRLAREWPIDWHGRPVVRYRQHPASMSTAVAQMLRETLSILDAAGADDAARTGWKRWYGDRLADVARGRWKDGDRRGAVSAAWAMARLCPADAARHTMRALTRRVQAGAAIPASEI
jgi:glycosyltransferase involved in cell wall biosynthesis